MIDSQSRKTSLATSLRRKLATMAAQSPATLALVPLCWALIAISDIVIIAIPFRYLARWTGRAMGQSATVPVIDEPQLRRARTIGRAIVIAARAAPFRANCYPQALTAVALCAVARVPTALFFGAAFAVDGDNVDSALLGHAWVVSGPITMTGGATSFDRFPALACFLRLHH